MTIRSREIGWSPKSNALYDIMKQLDRMIGISSKWLHGDFHQGTSEPSAIPEGAIFNAAGTHPVLTANGDYILKVNNA